MKSFSQGACSSQCLISLSEYNKKKKIVNDDHFDIKKD